MGGFILADLDCNFDIPCVIQWALLVDSTLSNLYHEENGTQQDLFHKTANTAIKWACGHSCGGFSVLVVP